MAYRCQYCNVGFAFQSKLLRHQKHIQFVSALEHSPENSGSYTEVDRADIFEDMAPSTISSSNLDQLDLGSNLVADLQPVENEEDNQHAYDRDTEENSDDADDDIISLLSNEEDDANYSSNDYEPFASKLHALVFMLMNSPRPIGENNLKFIVSTMKELNLNIPSIDSLKKVVLPGYLFPMKCYSNEGTPFYMLPPSSAVKKAFGVHHLAKSLVRYPIETENCIKEFYHADRWHQSFPSPMVLEKGYSIFVNDFITFNSDTSGIDTGKVIRFFQKGDLGPLCVEILLITDLAVFLRNNPTIEMLYYLEDSDAFVISQENLYIPITSIVRRISTPKTLFRNRNYRLIQLNEQEYITFTSKHHLQVKHGSKPVFIAPIVLYSDDTSGNRSKKWNKFDCWCLSMAGLPINIARNMENIHFICCSNRVSAMNMTAPLVEDLLKLENGIEVYDAYFQAHVFVYCPVLCCLCDNVRAAELVNHLGSKALRLCRLCMTDSSNATCIGQLRIKEVCMSQIAEISRQVAESHKSQLRKRYGLRDTANPLFAISTDLYKSTPVEVLHTVLLGICKYMLRSFMDQRSSIQKKEILARVSDFPTSGLSCRITGNICYHYNSFVGRDFKAWMQMAMFIVPYYTTAEDEKCWFLLSKVFQICYVDSLQKSKISHYRQICTQFVEATKEYMPQYSQRLKVHLLLHLVDSITEFGATSCYSTERYEAFNGFIRSQNIYGNRHSPSKDIANKFSVLEYLRYICAGGYINETFKCGTGLLGLYFSPKVQVFLNCLSSKEVYSAKQIYQHGCLRKYLKRHGKCGLLDAKCTDDPETSLKKIIRDENLSFHVRHCSMDETVSMYGGVIASNGVLVNSGNFISTTNPLIKYAYIMVCCLTQSSKAICVVKHFKEVFDQHGRLATDKFDCPLLTMTSDLYDIPTTDVNLPISVIHSCTDTCKVLQGHLPVIVERETVASSNKFVMDHDYTNPLYRLNIFAIPVSC